MLTPELPRSAAGPTESWRRQGVDVRPGENVGSRQWALIVSGPDACEAAAPTKRSYLSP
jgi:hypothetical protein